MKVLQGLQGIKLPKEPTPKIPHLPMTIRGSSGEMLDKLMNMKSPPLTMHEEGLMEHLPPTLMTPNVNPVRQYATGKTILSQLVDAGRKERERVKPPQYIR